MREDLIERLRTPATMSQFAGKDGMIAALLAEREEAAAALEAAREDGARLDALEALVDSCDDRALLIHHGRLPNDRFLYCGLGLSNTGRTLRQAIDQARGKGGGEVDGG